MRRTALFALVGAVAVAAILGMLQRDAEVSARPIGLLQEFRGGELDRDVWSTCHWWSRRGCTIGSNEELEWYLPGQVRVRRGTLRLVAEARPAVGADGRRYPYRSGMVSSGPPHGSGTPKFAFLYGRAEIRARMPRGKGLWPAFWLLPAERVSRPEIDIVEMYGDEADTARLRLHYSDADGEAQKRGRYYVDDRLRRGWHRFGIEWRPGRLSWIIDGTERWRVEGPEVPSVPMYLVLNLAVGGESAGAPDAATRFPARFKVDWVRVTP